MFTETVSFSDGIVYILLAVSASYVYILPRDLQYGPEQKLVALLLEGVDLQCKLVLRLVPFVLVVVVAVFSSPLVKLPKIYLYIQPKESYSNFSYFKVNHLENHFGQIIFTLRECTYCHSVKMLSRIFAIINCLLISSFAIIHFNVTSEHENQISFTS